MSVNLNQKQILSIVIVAVIAVSLVVVLKTVPLKTVTEDYGSQSFTISYKATTTLTANKDWTVSGSYSASQDCKISFKIYSPDGKTTIYEKTGASSGSFSFIADVTGGYKVEMIYSGYNPYQTTVILEAIQTIKTTII